MGGMSEANDSKVNLDVPEHLEYSDEHVWVDSSVEPAMVGVTEYATEQFGELVYIDLPEVGTQVEAGDEVAEFESSKAVTALVSPVVLFAFINGGGTLIATVVAALLYREKLTPTSTAGVLLGIASLVCIKVF